MDWIERNKIVPIFNIGDDVQQIIQNSYNTLVRGTVLEIIEREGISFYLVRIVIPSYGPYKEKFVSLYVSKQDQLRKCEPITLEESFKVIDYISECLISQYNHTEELYDVYNLIKDFEKKSLHLENDFIRLNVRIMKGQLKRRIGNNMIPVAKQIVQNNVHVSHSTRIHKTIRHSIF